MDKNLDHLTNPPLIGVRDEDALCPPTEPAAYMKWLGENREKLKAFFGFDHCALVDEADDPKN